MLLPFGVKVLWFILSVIGLVGCWFVSLALGRAIGSTWGPILYCVGCTMLEGMFCLGIFWRMDPFSMPPGFCIAQSIFIGFGMCLMTGVVGTFSFMTGLVVLKPKCWAEPRQAAFNWRHIYLFPAAVFPIAATGIHIAFVIRFNSVHPTTDFYCDSSSPQWVRFLSYAGVPILLYIPCLYLSIKTTLQVQKTNKHLKRARHSDLDVGSDSFTPIPRSSRSRKRDIQLDDCNSYPSQPPSLRFSTVPVRDPPSPATPAVHFHIPIKPPLKNSEQDASVSSLNEIDRGTIPSLSLFPGFANPDSNITITEEGRNVSSEYSLEQRDDWRDTMELTDSHTIDDKPSLLKWKEEFGDSETQSGIGYGKEDDRVFEDMKCEPISPRSRASSAAGMPFRSKRPPPPNLSPVIWRIIIFQIAFTAVQILANISTLVDVVSHRPSPTPLGTHHFAFLFAAWGPILVFGPLTGVRRLWQNRAKS